MTPTAVFVVLLGLCLGFVVGRVSARWEAARRIGLPMRPAIETAQARPRLLVSGKMTAVHDAKADRTARLFRSVPLNDVEKLPDPDYGL